MMSDPLGPGTVVYVSQLPDGIEQWHSEPVRQYGAIVTQGGYRFLSTEDFWRLNDLYAAAVEREKTEAEAIRAAALPLEIAELEAMYGLNAS